MTGPSIPTSEPPGPKPADARVAPPGKPRKTSVWRSGYAVIAVAIAALDQASKYWICQALPLRDPHAHYSIIPGFFALVHLRNTGAAWGMFQGWAHFLLVLSIVALGYITFRFRSLTQGRAVPALAIAMIAGGILGNLIDRLLRGEVVDFLLFYYQRWQFPAFNLADSAITCGAALYIVYALFFPSDE